jgi:hypothetical protein
MIQTEENEEPEEQEGDLSVKTGKGNINNAAESRYLILKFIRDGKNVYVLQNKI